MKTPGRGAGSRTVPAGVGAVYRRFLQEVRWAGWQSLGLATGLWLEAAVCTERFVVDLAEALERRRPKLVCWEGRIVRGVWGRLIRVVRWCEPGARAWHHLAARIDTTLIGRGGLAGHQDVSLPCAVLAVWAALTVTVGNGARHPTGQVP